MNQSVSISHNKWLNKIFKDYSEKNLFANVMPQSKAIPWFSIVGLTIAILFCIAFGSVLAHFMTREILNHDAVITKEFINSVEWVETKEAGLGNKISFGQLLDTRTDLAKYGVTKEVAASARRQYYDHISMILDVKLANVFALDRKIIWSTNSANIGTSITDSKSLETAFSSGKLVSKDSFTGEKLIEKHPFFSAPGTPFVESYIPMVDSKGTVVAIVEIYQEPHNLAQTISRGKLLIWLCIALGAAFLYAVPFCLFRRADGELQDKQQRLTEAETLCVIGEMSTAVAHGIRNPLASIRSSAELALEADPASARKNAEDIISQVDRLGKWVREFLTFSLPVAGENEVMNAVVLVETCLLNFSTQLKANNIAHEFERPTEDVPLIVGNRLLANQALASVISNAIEAMPTGGLLRLQLQVSTAGNCVDILVNDTGIGMSPTQIHMAFKPFYTTKRNGVGLGMAQVKRIMERFDGLVSLHSQEGNGTQACLSFRIA